MAPVGGPAHGRVGTAHRKCHAAVRALRLATCPKRESPLWGSSREVQHRPKGETLFWGDMQGGQMTCPLDSDSQVDSGSQEKTASPAAWVRVLTRDNLGLWPRRPPRACTSVTHAGQRRVRCPRRESRVAYGNAHRLRPSASARDRLLACHGLAVRLPALLT